MLKYLSQIQIKVPHPILQVASPLKVPHQFLAPTPEKTNTESLKVLRVHPRPLNGLVGSRAGTFEQCSHLKRCQLQETHKHATFCLF